VATFEVTQAVVRPLGVEDTFSPGRAGKVTGEMLQDRSLSIQ